jgi:ATP-binding cassette subfamily B (MDR/TAP) protein 1
MVIAKAMGAAEDLFKRIDRESKIDSLSPEGLQPSVCHGDIVLDKVDFAYPSRPTVQVLDGLSLVIPTNQTTAIVGPSGSGKSTIVGLLERWFSPLSGTITLDGRKIEDLNIQWLRTNIRLVQQVSYCLETVQRQPLMFSQEPVLFSGSIFQNVAYGLSGTSQADSAEDVRHRLVEQACKAAYAHDFIEKLPEVRGLQLILFFAGLLDQD